MDGTFWHANRCVGVESRNWNWARFLLRVLRSSSFAIQRRNGAGRQPGFDPGQPAKQFDAISEISSAATRASVCRECGAPRRLPEAQKNCSCFAASRSTARRRFRPLHWPRPTKTISANPHRRLTSPRSRSHHTKIPRGRLSSEPRDRAPAGRQRRCHPVRVIEGLITDVVVDGDTVAGSA